LILVRHPMVLRSSRDGRCTARTAPGGLGSAGWACARLERFSRCASGSLGYRACPRHKPHSFVTARMRLRGRPCLVSTMRVQIFTPRNFPPSSALPLHSNSSPEECRTGKSSG
jgi:hypothetical protein